jgi:molybdenum cofactor synthesis domain-containing protein
VRNLAPGFECRTIGYTTPARQGSLCYKGTVACSVVVVGDELLAGFTRDANAHWLAGQLRVLGFRLKRITVVRDLVAEIAEQLVRDLADPELEEIFCCGGLGPTPDDRTLAAVAAALGRELVVWPPILERLERRARHLEELGVIVAEQAAEGNRRMATIPDRPDDVLANRRGTAPGLLYRVDGHRLFVLPGVPAELRTIFAEELVPRHLEGGRPELRGELRFAFAVESRFTPVLRRLEASHPDVSVGSYPQPTRELVLRFAASSQRRLEEAMAAVRAHAAAIGLAPISP